MSRQSPDCPPGGKHATIREPTRRETAMANRRSGKLWTPGLLKSRGWTKELMAQLLPRPQYRRFNGRSVPHWHRDDVRAAEATAPFRPNPGGPCPGRRPAGRRGCGPSGSRPFGPGLAGRPPGRKPGLGCWPDIITRPLSPTSPAAARGRGAAVQSDFRLSQPISLPGNPLR